MIALLNLQKKNRILLNWQVICREYTDEYEEEEEEEEIEEEVKKEKPKEEPSRSLTAEVNPLFSFHF